MTATIGRSVVRRDGAVKVRGEARYAADFAYDNLAYAALVTSTVARGRIALMDTSEAEATPGFLGLLTHHNFNETLGEETFTRKGGHMQSSFLALTSSEIHYFGQIIGLVVADSQEAAEEAASRFRVRYESAKASAAIDDDDRVTKHLDQHSIDIGDAESAFAVAPVTIDADYSTPAQHHNPIELFSTTAVWRDDHLHVNVPTQWIVGTQAAISTILGLPRDNVKIECPYIGGAFGAKATVLSHTILVAVAARRVDRPVKLVVSREAMFNIGPFRPATTNRIRLAAETDGTITAVMQDEVGQTSMIDHVDYPATDVTARMYATDNIRMRSATVATDTNTPGFQRAPFEAPGFFAFESAVDELAVALAMDPIDLRRKNEPKQDPISGLPWSSRALIPCFERGADLFGWNNRNALPGSMTTSDGMLIGMGCAASVYPFTMSPSAARMRVQSDGLCIVSCAAHDLGTGAYTVLGQIAADALGVQNDMVRVELGDSSLPSGPLAAGSVTTASSGSAAHNAALAVRARILRLAGKDARTIEAGHVVFADGRRQPLADIAAATSEGMIEETVEWKPSSMTPEKMRHGMAGGMAFAGPLMEGYATYSWGAQFAEVRVDPLLRTIRVARMVGVFACGRIINPKTALNQLSVGMICAASIAQNEQTIVDRPRARFANTDLAGYHFSANADIGEVIVETLDEEDTIANAIGAKSVGEIGIVGMPAAVANAVYHATGIRVRKTPILMEDILPGPHPYL